MTEGLKVVSMFPFTAESLEELREAAQAEVLVRSNNAEFLAQVPEAEVLCAFRLPENIRELAPHLRWLQYPGAGVDALGPTGLLEPDSGVIITTASGIHATTISEYVFGSMLMFNRSWPELVRLQDRRIWGSTSWFNLRKLELAGQTLGIVGVGSIGRHIARLGHAFGMRVLGMKRSASKGDEDIDQYYTPAHLHELLGLSDYVVLATPLTPETEKMIGEAELRAMRKGAYLVNIARGRVVDEQALIRALREGWIAGAGLDVTEEEPLPADSPLYTMPNVILTPHISGETVYYDERLVALFVDNLRRYRAGQPLRNLYEARRGY